MITEAIRIGAALLGFPFRFEVNGYDTFLVQKCKLPGIEFEVVEIAGGGQTYAIKQAGGGKVTEWSAETIIPASGDARLFWSQWADLVATRDPLKYYRDITVTLLGPDDEPIMMWTLQDAWPSKPLEYEEFDADDKKKLARIKITGQCNRIVAEAK